MTSSIGRRTISIMHSRIQLLSGFGVESMYIFPKLLLVYAHHSKGCEDFWLRRHQRKRASLVERLRWIRDLGSDQQVLPTDPIYDRQRHQHRSFGIEPKGFAMLDNIFRADKECRV